MPRAHVLALLLLAAIPLGCANNVGPDGRLIGGPCLDELDCVQGAYCLSRTTFPDGTCTTNCASDEDCRGGSACVEIMAGACLLECEVDEDCGREGYVCRALTRRGAAGTSFVCAGE